MPHVSDVSPTSHDRHDALLVAALAAGDLTGTDRDHATSLIQTCADCASLHDDLLAIARATASVPPAIASRPRDFRLTAQQAARLRPAGWRRVVGAFATPRLSFTRPLGIGLTTIGLAGLLIGNIPLGLGGAAASAPTGASVAAPAASNASTATGMDSVRGAAAAPGSSSEAGPLVPVPAASAAATAAPAASGAPQTSLDYGGVRTAETPSAKAPVAAAASSGDTGTVNTPPTEQSAPPDLRTLIFVAAVLVGLGLLLLRRVARRVTIA